MPRPERICYEDACYHVMNRGRGRKTIFHDHRYYQRFLETLSEAQQRYNAIIHAYCLMGNHYHLLIQTPEANLSRIMRHINGVYTQRHNRLKHTDGPLFRGRYKAILIDKDAYLLQLSRYIHRNPIEMKRPLVQQLEDYLWSSYPAYINQVTAPDWLERDTTYAMLGSKQRYKGYQSYVMEGIDEDINQYYNRGNQASIVGKKAFREMICEEELGLTQEEKKTRLIAPEITISEITRYTAQYYKTTEKDIRRIIKGPQKGNEARKVAMYLSQEMGMARLQDIADHFNLGHAGSVSYNNHRVRSKRQTDKQFERKISRVIKSIINQLT